MPEITYDLAKERIEAQIMKRFASKTFTSRDIEHNVFTLAQIANTMRVMERAGKITRTGEMVSLGYGKPFPIYKVNKNPVPVVTAYSHIREKKETIRQRESTELRAGLELQDITANWGRSTHA